MNRIRSSLLACLAFTIAPALAAAAPALPLQAQLPGLGTVAYSAPANPSRGPVMVLLHGIYAGVSHRNFSELQAVLEARGARVYALDLLGAGESERARRVYTLDTYDAMIETFLREVVREKALLVGEQLLGLSALTVAERSPALVRGVVLVAPTGARYLREAPGAPQNSLFDKLWNDDAFGTSFFEQLHSEKSVRFYLNKAYYDPAQVTDERVQEVTSTSKNLGQRWLTYSFAGGKLHRKFEDAGRGLRQPVAVLIGEHPQAPTAQGEPETLADFRTLRPEFTYIPVPATANLPQREQPEICADHILAAASR